MNFSVLLPVIIAVIAVFIVIIARLKNKNKASYDERQTLARYSAFRTSFIFLLFYCFICATLYILDIKWSNTAVQMFIGCILSLSLFYRVHTILIVIYRFVYFERRLFFKHTKKKCIFRNNLFSFRNNGFILFYFRIC